MAKNTGKALQAQREHKTSIRNRVDGASLPDLAKMGDKFDALARRTDGWTSLLTGMGIAGRDKRTTGKLEWTGLLFNEHQAEATLASSNLARRIVEYLPYEATRMDLILKGFDENEQRVTDDMDRLDVRKNMFTAWSWGRAYGGAALLIMTDEGEEALGLPLKPEKVRKIESLIPLNRYELDAWSQDIETDLTSPNFRKPKFYRLNVTSGGIRVPVNVKIHNSRIIRFEGQELPPLLFIRNKYWGDSIFSGLMEAMRDYDMSHSGVSQVLNEFRFIVHSMPDLADSIAAGKQEAIQRRIMVGSASRNLTGSMAIDKEETVEIKSETFSGVDAMLDKMADRFAAHTEYPKIILFNESPEGSMGGNGSSELSNWYNSVKARQQTYLAPKLDQFFKVLLASKQGPVAGNPPKDWDYEFASLWSESAKEKADREKVEADTDTARMDQGVQDEVAIMQKRFPESLEGKDPEQLRKKIEEEKNKQMALEQQRLAKAPVKPAGV